MDWLIPILFGIGLSAATGLRVFLPFFLISLAFQFDLIQPNNEFLWLDNKYVALALGIATSLEILGFYTPIIDHFMDIVGMPLVLCAGFLSMFSVLPEMPFHAEYLLSLIGGGGTALSINNLTGVMRIKTTASFYGLANSTYSTLENILCVCFLIFAFLIPIVFGILIIMTVFFSFRVIRNFARKILKLN